MKTPNEIISACCNGDEVAVEFCEAFWGFCHAIDDFVDRDSPLFKPKDFINAMLHFLVTVSLNPFYIIHKQSLLPVIIQSAIAWGDSMQWECSGNSIKVNDAEVLKGMYHEVFYHVAFLVGGLTHAQSVTHRFREYNHEDRMSNYGTVR